MSGELFTTVQGQCVGVDTERWGGGDSGKPAGVRHTLYVQQNESGRSAPTSVTVPDQFAAALPSLGMGAVVQVAVKARAWSSNGRGELMLTAVDSVRVAASVK